MAKFRSIGRQEGFRLGFVISALGFINRDVSAEEGRSAREAPREGGVGSRKAVGVLSLTQRLTFKRDATKDC